MRALLSQISDDLSANELPVILIGNIITSVVRKKPTSLHNDLALLVREKKLIEHLYDYKVVCSYDKRKRFKASAAVQNTKNTTLNLRNHSQGSVQAVADNFDTTISSQDGKKQTHSLALLLTQPSGDEHIKEQLTFPKLKKTDIKNSDLPHVPIHSYSTPKKPSMPANALQRQVHSLNHLVHQEIIKRRGQQLDFEFVKSIATNPKTPEHSGYNTRYVRELGALKGKKTMAVHTPLIDQTPSDPTTIMTAMTEAKRITDTTGQKYTIFTCDQQPCKLLVDIK